MTTHRLVAFLPAAHPSVLCKQRGGNLSRARRGESDPERAKKGRRDDDREEGRDENEGICQMRHQRGIGGWTGLAHPITGSFNSAGSALSANIHNAIRYNCWPGFRFNSVVFDLQHHFHHNFHNLPKVSTEIEGIAADLRDAVESHPSILIQRQLRTEGDLV